MPTGGAHHLLQNQVILAPLHSLMAAC